MSKIHNSKINYQDKLHTKIAWALKKQQLTL